MTEEEYQAEREIEMLDKYLKMCERNASEKERFRFAQEYGFVSEKHFKLWLSTNDDLHNLQLEIEHGLYQESEYPEKQAKLKELEQMAKNIRSKSYYRIIMHMLHKKDFSPYGEDLLRRKNRWDEETWTVDIEKTAASGYTNLMSYAH